MTPPAKRHIHPPRLRTAHNPDAERHATWLELFFDLVLVVAVASLAQALVADPSVAGFARVAGLFLPVFVAWQGFSLYSDRFDNDDLIHRLALFAGMFAVGSLSVQIDAVAHGKSFGFAVSYIALRLLTIFLYGRAYRHNPTARPLLTRYISGYSVSVAFWVASVFLPAPLRYVFWGLGIASDLLMPPLSLPLIRATPISGSHLSERFGLFTLLVMGESVVAVTLGLAKTTLTPLSVAASVTGLVIAATLWWLYYDDGREMELKPGSTAVAFAYAHIPLLLALTVIGGGVHLCIEETGAGAAHLATGARWAVGGGIALFLLSLSLIHREQIRDIQPAAVGFRLAVSLAVVTMTAFGAHWHPLIVGTATAGLLVALVVAENSALKRHARGT